MAIDNDDFQVRGSLLDILDRTSSGAIRVTLLFGSAAIALAMILTPIANQQVARSTFGHSSLDPVATGSTRNAGDPLAVSRSYTIRRSVLQDQGGLCIINANGMRTGSC
jgi:hypothetical protein